MRRFISMLLAAIMIFSIIPATVQASEVLPQNSTVYGVPVSEVNTGDMSMVPYNNPALETNKLAVGITGNLAVVDYNHDGYLDILASTGAVQDKVTFGTFVFYGGPESRKNNIMSKGHYVYDVQFSMSSALYDKSKGIDGKYNYTYKDTSVFFLNYLFTNINYWSATTLDANVTWPKTNTDYNDYVLADYNGDGYLDLIRGVSNWNDYGWSNKYYIDTDGEAKWGDDNRNGYLDEGDDFSRSGVTHKDTDYTDNDPVHGHIMVILNNKVSEGMPTNANFSGTAELISYKDSKTGEDVIIDVFGSTSPNFYDWDRDGDLDLVCGDFWDDIFYFENIGSATEPVYAEPKSLKLTDGTDFHSSLCIIRPIVFDWNGDGHLDIIYNQEDGYIMFLENTGRWDSSGVPIMKQPVNFLQESDMLKLGAMATPFSLDWDGDGDEDLFSGATDGCYYFIENVTPAGGDLTNPSWNEPIAITDENGEPYRIMAGMTGSIQGPTEKKWGYSTIGMGDWDEDGDMDIVANNIWGKVVWLENLNEPGEHEIKFAAPKSVKVNSETPAKPMWNWWDPEPYEFVSQWRTSPFIIDLDEDGLCDIVMLDHEGYISFFKKSIGEDGVPMVEPSSRIFYTSKGSALQLAGAYYGDSGRVKFCLTDWDSDGDLDIIRNNTISVAFLENLGDFYFADPVTLHERIIACHSTAPTVVDWNKDGVPDLLVGAEDGHFYYMLNNHGKTVDYSVLEDNLITHWDFENTGDIGSEILDKASNGNSTDNLTVANEVVIENGVATIPANWAGEEGGSVSAIVAGNGVDVNQPAMTIFMRVKLGDGDLEKTIMLLDKWGTGYELSERGYRIGIDKDGYFRTMFLEASYGGYNQVIPQNEWRELAVVFRKDDAGIINTTAYVSSGESATVEENFVEVFRKKSTVNSLSTECTSDLWIGRSRTNDAFGVDVSFDDIRIYNAALSPAQLAKIDVGTNYSEKDYYVLAGGTGDGTSPSTPAPSVESILPLVNSDLTEENDIANVYIMQVDDCLDKNIALEVNPNGLTQSYFTPWIIRDHNDVNATFPLTTHKATLRVTSYDPENNGVINYLAYSDKIGVNFPLRLSGPTIFEDIALVRPWFADREIIACGYDVEFKNTKFYRTDANEFNKVGMTKLDEGYFKFWAVDHRTVLSKSQTIKFNTALDASNHAINILGGASHNPPSEATFYPISYYFNNPGINGNISWGSESVDNITRAKGGLNIIVNDAGTLRLLDRKSLVEVKGGLQVILNNGEEFPEIPATVTADKKWVLKSEKKENCALDITDTDGTFKVLGGKFAFALSSDKKTAYYAKDTITLKPDTYIVTYADSVEEFMSSASDFANDFENGKEFAGWIKDENENVIRANFVDHVPEERNYYVIAGGTGDGRTVENPAPSVEAVIPAINADLFANDIARVNIMQKEGCPDNNIGLTPDKTSSFTPWIIRSGNDESTSTPYYSHKAKMIVTTYNYEKTQTKNYIAFTDKISSNHSMRLSGPTVFENIIIVRPWTGERELFARGYSVEFNNSEFFYTDSNWNAGTAYSKLTEGKLRFFAQDGTTTMTAPQTIRFNSRVLQGYYTQVISFIGGSSASAPSETKYPVSFYFNNSEIEANIGWGIAGASGETKISAGLNIVTNDVKKFTLQQTEFTTPVTVKGGLQIVNNNGKSLPAVPSNVTADKTWIMNSAKDAGGTLDVTDTAGTFKVLGGKYAFVVDKTSDLVYYGNDTITVPAGTHTVQYASSIEEFSASLGAFANDYDKNREFVGWQPAEEGEGYLIPTYTDHVPQEKSYYVISGGTGDGSSRNKPAGSVEIVIEKISTELPYSNDIARVYIMQKANCPADDMNKTPYDDNKNLNVSTFTPWLIRNNNDESTSKPKFTHKAKMIVSSVDYETTKQRNYLAFTDRIGTNHSMRLAGPTVFENVILLRPWTAEREIISCGYSVEFNNVSFSRMNASAFADGKGSPLTEITEDKMRFLTVENGSSVKAPLVIRFNSPFVQGYLSQSIGIVGAGNNLATIEYPVTYYFDHVGINGNISFAEGNATLTKGLNIIYNSGTSLTNIAQTNTLNVTGGLQVINNNGMKFVSIPSNVVADKTWIMNSAKDAGGTLDVTDTAGTFKVLGGKYAFVHIAGSNIAYYGNDTITVPEGTYNVVYYNSVEEFSENNAFGNTDYENLIESVWVEDAEKKILTAVTRKHEPKEKSYYVISGGTGDGRTVETPAPSVEEVIPAINNDLKFANDIARVYIMQKENCPADDMNKTPYDDNKNLNVSTFTPWLIRNNNDEGSSKPKYTHTVKMIVSTYDYDETTNERNYLAFTDRIGTNHSMRLAGPTVFENIILLRPWTAEREIISCGYSVEFNNVSFSRMNANVFGAGNGAPLTEITEDKMRFLTVENGSSVKAPLVIRFNSPFLQTYMAQTIGIVGAGTNLATINYPVTYYFDHEGINGYVSFAEGNATLTKGLNIIYSSGTSLTNIAQTNTLNVTGGLQVINNNGMKFPEIPANVVADKVWVMNSAKDAGGILDVTDTAGTFKVLGGKYAFAQVAGSSIAYYGNDTITVPEGTYTVVYYDSVQDFCENSTFGTMDYENLIESVWVEDAENKILTATTRKHEPEEKHFYVLSGGTGDGRTVETPAPSVEELIPTINEDVKFANDIAIVNIMQKPGEGDLDEGKLGAEKSNYTAWYAGRTAANEAHIAPKVSHKVKIVVTTYNYEQTGKKNYLIFSDMIGGMHPLRLLGPTEFKDIVLFSPYHPNAVVARGYSVTFTNTDFKASRAAGWDTPGTPHSFVPDGYVAVAATDGTGSTATESQVITLNSNVPFATMDVPNIRIVEHEYFRSAGTINRNITYRFNNSELQAGLGFGGAGSSVSLTKGLNIVVDNVKAFVGTKVYNTINITGGLQIVNNNGLKFPDVSAIFNTDKTWIVNSAKNSQGTVDVTDTAGTFDVTVTGGKTPVAVGKDGKVYTATKVSEVKNSGNLNPETNYATNVYGDYIEYRRPLTNTYNKLTKDKELNVLYFGGSITAGYGSSDSSKYSWRALTDAWLKETFPTAKINPIDRTIGETGTLLGAYRLDSDILNLENTPAPDLMFLEYSINDSYNDNLSNEEKVYYAGLQYETIVREVKEKYPECDIVTVYSGDVNTIEAHRNGKLHPTAEAHDVIAEIYNIPALKAGPMLSNVLKGSSLSEWKEDFFSTYNFNRDTVHLNDAGNAEYFKIVKEYLNNALLGTEHGDETVYTEIPAVVSDHLFDGERTIYPMTEELIAKSEALGGHGFTAKSQWMYYIYDTAAATTSNTSKFVFEFEGTELDIVTNFKSGIQVGSKLTVSLDGGDPFEVNLTGNAPLMLFKNLESKKHRVEIIPSTFPNGVNEFQIQLLMTSDRTKNTPKGTAGYSALTNYSITLPEGEYDMYYLDGSTVGDLPFALAGGSKILTGFSDGTSVITDAKTALNPAKTYTAVTTDVDEYLGFEGVQIRLETGEYKQGLRFVADKKNSFASDKFGMVLIPSKFIGDTRAYTDYSSAGENSTNNIVGADKLFIDSTHEYGGRTYYSANVVAQKIFSEYEDGVLYTTCLIGIEEIDYATYYTAKAYITYTFGDKEYVAYSAPFRSSIYEVAQFALDNDNRLDNTSRQYLQSITDVVQGK